MDSVLKKKALTAVLTAAFVLGIGGMATESISTHEYGQVDTCIRGLFEPAVVHAAPYQLANWRCFCCGKTGQSTGNNFGNSKELRTREPNMEEKCPHKHDEANGKHLWVWVSGVPPVSDYTTYYYCRRCNEFSARRKPGNYPPHYKGCSLNNRGPHDWAPTGIIRTR